MFPCLELIRLPTEPPSLMRVGQRWDLRPQLLIGAEHDADVQLRSRAVAPRHAMFEREAVGWSVIDFDTQAGTFLNGQRLRAFHATALRHGDEIEFPYDTVFRYLERPWVPDLLHGAGEFVASVSEHPGDDARWRVWSDFFLERGHPLGERMVTDAPKTTEQLVRTFGPSIVSRDVIDGRLELEWRFGFVRRAVFRNLLFNNTFLPSLQQLLGDPSARFLQHLEVDVLSFARGVSREELSWAERRIIEAQSFLATQLKPRPPLQTVRFGAFPQPMWTPALANSWHDMVGAYPALAPAGSPVVVARTAALRLTTVPATVAVAGLQVGEARVLDDHEATLLGPIPECQFQLLAPEGSPASEVGCRLERESGQWWVTDVVSTVTPDRRGGVALEVNGREQVRQRVRHGDVLEVMPGLTFLFELT